MRPLFSCLSVVLLGGVLAFTTFYSSASAQTSSTLQFSPIELRQLAANAVIEGQPELGYQMTTALLRRDPNDTEALIIQARAARDLGRVSEATSSARRAWGQSSTASERFGASMVMAQALSSSGARTRAQLWLRRAAQNAPSDEFKQIAIRDFRYVQKSNPWATELSFAVAPSSNINNGSARSSTRLFDLPFEFQLSGAARALSGIQYNAGIATRYRLSESERFQNDLLVRLDHRTYTMSPEAKGLAPNAKGSDFAFSSASLTYIRRGFSSAGFEFPNQLEISGGRTWYAQKPFMQYARVSFTQNYVFAPGSFVFGGVSREVQKSMSTRKDVDSWNISGGVRVTTHNQNRVTFSLNAKKSNSLDSNLDFQQITFSTRYALARPIAGVSIDFGMSVSKKDHETSRFSRFGRQDNTVSLDVTGVFNRIEYFGFSPSVTLTANQTSSTIGLYESQGVGFRLGIQSSF